LVLPGVSGLYAEREEALLTYALTGFKGGFNQREKGREEAILSEITKQVKSTKVILHNAHPAHYPAPLANFNATRGVGCRAGPTEAGAKLASLFFQ